MDVCAQRAVRKGPSGLVTPLTGWRVALATVIVMACAGCVGPQPLDRSGPAGERARDDSPLRPWTTIATGRLLGAVGPLGQPVPGSTDRLLRLLRPTAAATRHNDLYILDVGLGALLRHDLALGTFARVPAVNARVGVRLAVQADLSVLVLDPLARRILHLSRAGRLLRAISSDTLLGRPVDFAVDEAGGNIHVVDALSNRIVAFRIAGGAATTIVTPRDARDVAHGLAAIAVGADAMFLLDRLGRQILRIAPDGRVLEAFGHADLAQPEAIATDRHGRVYVVDAQQNALKVFAGRQVVAVFPAARLGVQRVGDITVSEGVLSIVDPDGAQVLLMRIVPPARIPPLPAPEAR